MVFGRLPILEQCRCVIDVVHHDVEIAVIVQIADGQPAANPGELQATAGAIRNIAEPSAKVQQQLVLLTVRFAKLRVLVDVRENVTVGEEKIELPIEVGIEKGGSPSHANECGGGNARRHTGVLEMLAIEVVKQRVVIVSECREHEIDSAVAIVIAGVDAHPGLGASLAVEGHAGVQANALKAPVPKVVIQEVRVRIIRDEQVHPSVIIVIGRHHTEAVSLSPIGQSMRHRSPRRTCRCRHSQRTGRTRQEVRLARP